MIVNPTLAGSRAMGRVVPFVLQSAGIKTCCCAGQRCSAKSEQSVVVLDGHVVHRAALFCSATSTPRQPATPIIPAASEASGPIGCTRHSMTALNTPTAVQNAKPNPVRTTLISFLPIFCSRVSGWVIALWLADNIRSGSGVASPCSIFVHSRDRWCPLNCGPVPDPLWGASFVQQGPLGSQPCLMTVGLSAQSHADCEQRDGGAHRAEAQQRRSDHDDARRCFV